MTKSSERVDVRDVARRTGLMLLERSAAAALPLFVHGPTQQEFALVPGGSFAMGMTADELVAALRDVHFDPDIQFWRDQHRRQYECSNPVHQVSIQPFLCGRSPLLGRTVSSVDGALKWSTHETAEHRGQTVAAAITAGDATRVMDALGWSLISEAQWEYVARCGGAQSWAEKTAHIDVLQCDSRYASNADTCNSWGIWGLGLGEWVADEWHERYTNAPFDGSAWRAHKGPPGSVRGGAVLHAPWQDSGEAMSCHASWRGGKGEWRGIFTVRPVIALPWLHAPPSRVQVAAYVPFDEAIAKLESQIRTEKMEKRRADEARRARHERLVAELPGSVQEGTIRSAGGEGVYVVRLAEANAILRLPGENIRLKPGTKVTVRVVGAGGVPDAELVSIHD